MDMKRSYPGVRGAWRWDVSCRNSMFSQNMNNQTLQPLLYIPASQFPERLAFGLQPRRMFGDTLVVASFTLMEIAMTLKEF
jgi:hypothetical protein